MQKRIALLVFAILTLTLFASAQASPPASASCDLGGGKTIKTDYSSPRAKGRKIYGGLVPFGEVWRTGANSATTFVTSADVVVGGKTVPAGSYTIFTVPAADKWTLIINKKTGEWGIPYKYESDELARVDMKVRSCPRRWRTSPSPTASPAAAALCNSTGRRLALRWTSRPNKAGEELLIADFDWRPFLMHQI